MFLTPSSLNIARDDRGLKCAPIVGKQGPFWQQLTRRVVIDFDTQKTVLDQEILPYKGKAQYHTLLPNEVTNIRTDFFFRPEENVRPTECLPAHQIRQLNAQVRRSECHKESFLNGKRFLVTEVLSPPRFAQAARDEGFEARSYDLLNGYDFRRKEDREAVRQELRKHSPDLLVLCPPCTHEGGWWHWNASQMSPETMLKLRRQSIGSTFAFVVNCTLNNLREASKHCLSILWDRRHGPIRKCVG